jgi:hypothetical protein
MNACRALLIASVVHGAVRVMISERMSITTLCLIAALAHVLRERLAAGSGGLASSNEQVVSGTG